MSIPDLVNSLFNVSSSFFILNHCRVLLKQKSVRGVSVLSVGFFSVFSVYSVYYFWHLNQPLSLYGSALLGAFNTLYLAMLIYYRKHGNGDTK